MNESNISELRLEKVSVLELSELISESQNAFLAPAQNPTETASDLFNIFQSRYEHGVDRLYQPLAYKHQGEAISYIVVLGYRNNMLAIGPMYVSKKYRGCGLGTKQVKDFIDYAKSRGFDGVYTKTWGKNEASRSIFQKAGFKMVGVRPNDRVDGDSTIKYLLEF